MIRLLPLFIMACGSLVSAQSVEDNAAKIAANADAIAKLEDRVGDNHVIFEARSDLKFEHLNGLSSTVSALEDWVDDNESAVAAATAPPADAPNASLPYRIPPAFIVHGGWFEIHWICADTVAADCDLGMLGDGGDVIVLQGAVVPMFVGGREADTAVNSNVLSISAIDPESYWLGAPQDGDPPPEHLWLVHAQGWLHAF